MVYGACFFCLDTARNILISDFHRHSIKILSPSGQLIHQIGKVGHGRGELFYPFGICLSQTGNIFVVSHNSNLVYNNFSLFVYSSLIQCIRMFLSLSVNYT